MYKLASLIPGPKDELPLIGLAHKFAGDTEGESCNFYKRHRTRQDLCEKPLYT